MARAALAEDPVLFAAGGADEAFHVIYARLADERLLISPQRDVVNQLLRDHPYSLFVFSNEARTNWHFLNVKYDDSIEKRRLFRRIAIGPFERLRTAAERISLLDLDDISPDIFGLSPLDIQERHDEAFDVEKVQKDFFHTLQIIYEENIVPDILKGMTDENKAREAGLILLNRLIFLYFIQKKGWLNSGRKTKDDRRKAEYLPRAFKDHREKKRSRSYYSEFLCLLFQALAVPKIDRTNLGLPSHFNAIPFLNGGLFEPEVLITRDAELRVTNATFSRLFDELLERFNFTVTEDTPFDVEVAVDPEMLGKIFEELVTGRHDSGAYYTPRPVVSFMCKEALTGYLEGGDAVEKFIGKHDASSLKNPEAILEKLRGIKVCDPACGSGAYLVGMLQELIALRHALFAAHKVDHHTDYQRKLDIVQNCLYGVDIDPIAVNIARLRLWLTLCVEYETEDGGDPPPLPNLDFKIEQADSVLAATVSDLTPSGAEGECDTSIEGPGAYRHLIPELDKLKAEYLREPYNKGPIRKKIARLRETISSWIVNDQNNPAGIDFDWRIDFAEIFGIEDAPGFDIILANPPYVRMELIKPMKPHLKLLYPDFYAGRADLFTYFFARGMELLRQGGRLVFICSSTWTKTAAAKKLRDFLRERATVHHFLDFGDLPVFENVTTYPAIIIAERAKPPKNHEIRANRIKTVLHSELEQELHAPGILVPQRELDSGGWRFEDRRVARLRQKIQDAGVPLKDYCGSPLYGIKTGLNAAFVIDQQKRDALVAADPRSEEILKPFLEGKDLKPWRAKWRRLWLIYTIHGIEISNYPAIENHLRPYKQRLEERATSHLHPWYELQQPQYEYSKAMEKPKIMYPDITVNPKFAYDDSGLYFGNTTYFIPNASLFLQGILSSSPLWWQLAGMVRLMRGGYLRLFTQYMEVLPIAQAGKADARKIASLAEALSEGSGGVSPPNVGRNVGQDAPPPLIELEEELNDRVAALYGLTPQERKIIEQSGR